jgi:DNA-binding transcriptional ArsR family regulator
LTPHRSTTLSPSRARVRSTIAAIIDQPDELRALRSYHKALADVNRLRIVQRLALGEASVTELIDHVGLSQPLVSWHVGKLREARVVETSRVGRETVCRLRPETFAEFGARARAVLGLDRMPLAPAERPRSAPVPAARPEEAVS